MKASEFLTNICNATKLELDCGKDRTTKMDISGFQNLSKSKGFDLDLKQVCVIAGSVVVLAMLLIGVISLCRKMNTSGTADRRANNVTCSETILIGSDSGSDALGNRSRLIMKPSKSFSIDDHLIIKETLHQMKGRYPAELYDQVHNNTMKVLNAGLHEPEQVAAIGEIIEALRECQKSGGDFVAFTAILYKQLEPIEDSPPLDAIYSEVRGAASAAGDGNENVYAEPQHLQRCPLLTEYSSPMDIENGNYAEYAEPHLGMLCWLRIYIS